MAEITIEPVGVINMKAPANFCTIGDVSTAWSALPRGSMKEIKRTRVCAAAVGIVAGGDNDLPVYDWIAGDLFTYGAAIQDQLMRRGVTLISILEAGVEAFNFLCEQMPKQKEVDEITAFSGLAEERRISSP
jgi:hypothetical protein